MKIIKIVPLLFAACLLNSCYFDTNDLLVSCDSRSVSQSVMRRVSFVSNSFSLVEPKTSIVETQEIFRNEDNLICSALIRHDGERKAFIQMSLNPLNFRNYQPVFDEEDFRYEVSSGYIDGSGSKEDILFYDGPRGDVYDFLLRNIAYLRVIEESTDLPSDQFNDEVSYFSRYTYLVSKKGFFDGEWESLKSPHYKAALEISQNTFKEKK